MDRQRREKDAGVVDPKARFSFLAIFPDVYCSFEEKFFDFFFISNILFEF